MKRFSLLICLAFVGCTDSSPSNIEGETPKVPQAFRKAGSTSGLDALKDIAAGKLVLLEQPIPAPGWYGDYHKALKDRGIEVKVITHPDVRLTAEEVAYNAAMIAEIEKKHGGGIVGKLLQEAEANYMAKYQKPKQ